MLFSTYFPSSDSIKLLAYAGIKEVVYRGEVSANLSLVLEQHGINFRYCQFIIIIIITLARSCTCSGRNNK